MNLLSNHSAAGLENFHVRVLKIHSHQHQGNFVSSMHSAFGDEGVGRVLKHVRQGGLLAKLLCQAVLHPRNVGCSEVLRLWILATGRVTRDMGSYIEVTRERGRAGSARRKTQHLENLHWRPTLATSLGLRTL